MRFECHQHAAFGNIFNFKEMKEADNQIADRGHDQQNGEEGYLVGFVLNDGLGNHRALFMEEGGKEMDGTSIGLFGALEGFPVNGNG